MAKTVEVHGTTFIHRKPAAPGVYLCVRVHAPTHQAVHRVETAYISDDWTIISGQTILHVERWLTRGGQIRKGVSFYFTEKTIGEMNIST